MPRLLTFIITAVASVWVWGCQTADSKNTSSSVKQSTDNAPENIPVTSDSEVDCELLEKTWKRACCAGQSPTCFNCKNEVAEARKNYDEKCSSHALLKKCDTHDRERGKSCCAAQTPSCFACKDKVKEAQKIYDHDCAEHALAKKCLDLDQESKMVCCAAQTPTCFACKDKVKEAREAFDANCSIQD